jgi:uncharacterized protein
MVIWRHLRPSAVRLDDRGFVAVGAAAGFGSASVGSVGPMVAPFFLARGLVRGAYVGTEAASAVVMHTVKLIVFGAAAVLTWAGKKIVDRLPVSTFVAVVEVGLVASGLLLTIPRR